MEHWSKYFIVGKKAHRTEIQGINAVKGKCNGKRELRKNFFSYHL